MNYYLKPLVDKLLEHWKGTYLTAPDRFVPVHCAFHVKCVDLHLSIQLNGCSKCMKKFTCDAFGSKSDYSGYEI